VVLAVALIIVFSRPPAPTEDGSLSDTPQITEPVEPTGPPDPPEPPKPIDISEDIPSNIEKPGGRAPSFELIEAGYTAYDPRVEMIEINQALSYGFDTETAGFYVMTDFVAGRDTGIFIALTEPIAQSIYLSSFLTVEKDGIMLGYMIPYDAVDDYTLLYQPADIAGVGFWAQGGYTFRLYIDDIEAAVRTANFFETMPLRILGVPILANYSGQVAACQGEWRNGAEWLVAAFPVARRNIEYVLGPELDLSDISYDLNTNQGMRNVWQALADMQTPDNSYTLIVGFVRNTVGNGAILGFTYGSPANVVVESGYRMPVTVAHEIAHCYSIGDEYEGGSLNLALNQPPYGMGGRDILTRRDVVGDNPNVVSGQSAGASGTGSAIYTQQRAYWAVERRQLDRISSYMGISTVTGTGIEAFWTSSDIYEHLFKVFSGYYGDYTRPRFWGVCPSCYMDVYDANYYRQCGGCGSHTLAPELGVQHTCGTCSNVGSITWRNCYVLCTASNHLVLYETFHDYNRSSSQEAVAAETHYIKAVRITGEISSSGVFTPLPWYTYEVDASAQTPILGGEYSVLIFDADGKQISVAGFNVESAMQVTTDAGQSLVPADNMPVSVTVRFPENAARIVIRKGDREIYSTNVSQTAPQVSFTGISDGQDLGDRFTLAWEVSGGAAGLHYEIWYCPADGELHHVASNVTERSYQVDLSGYPGTDRGYFVIYATDGVLTGENRSPWIRVPHKAPVIMTGQTGIAEFRVTDEVRLYTRIYDLQDGWLNSSDAVWMLDGEEYSPHSGLWIWPYRFAPGEYTFTLVATNSKGISTSKDFRYRFVDDESALPNDWSRDEIRTALRRGMTASSDRFDGPVTRGEFAKFAIIAAVHLLPWDEIPIDLSDEEIAVVVKDCGLGLDRFFPYYIVRFGLMDAPNGYFDPHKTMTEREAMMIMYRILLLYNERAGGNNPTEAELVSLFESINIIGSGGQNSYAGDERLTCKIAMIRMSRMFEYFYS